MATINPEITELPPYDNTVMKFTWTLTGTDEGAAMPFTPWADRSVAFVGTWGGGTVVWEGSNDNGANYFTLTDPQTTPITKIANSLEQVIEISELARPRASSAVTNVVVTCVARRQTNSRS